MLKKSENEAKLVPLRKFAIPGIYSVAYLSQLVQRKKLKAKKIGRNYFTSQVWFDEYLGEHAQDRKIEKYQNHLKRQENKEETPVFKSEEINVKSNISFVKKIAISVAIFVLLMIGVRFFIAPYLDKGQVAGEKEKVVEIGTISTSTSETELDIEKLKEAIEILKKLESQEK